MMFLQRISIFPMLSQMLRRWEYLAGTGISQINSTGYFYLLNKENLISFLSYKPPEDTLISAVHDLEY